MTSFSISAAGSVQRLRRDGGKKGGVKKRKTPNLQEESAGESMSCFVFFACTNAAVWGGGGFEGVSLHISGHP